MFKRKQQPFNYNEAVLEISKQLRNNTIQLSDPSYEGENKKTFLAYNLNDLNKLLRSTTTKTRELLTEKGFTLTIDDRVEKTVLLNTEISELADAVKKGLGRDAEGAEIADIVIRATNFLCLDETYHSYQKLSNVLAQTPSNTDKVTVGACVSDSESKLKKDKYSLIEDMMVCWIEIKRASEMVWVCCTDKLGEDKFNTAFIILWNKVIDLIAYCSAYTTLYLPGNLQYYIGYKMNENFKRPYKYGTSEEVK